jgi:hypothetical protein
MRPEEENVYQHPVTAVLVLFITCHLISILPLGLATTPRPETPQGAAVASTT